MGAVAPRPGETSWRAPGLASASAMVSGAVFAGTSAFSARPLQRARPLVNLNGVACCLLTWFQAGRASRASYLRVEEPQPVCEPT